MRIRRLLIRTVVAVPVLAFLLLRPAGSASAHAQLEASDPHADDVVSTAPQRVSLAFGEPVEVAGDAIEVFDDQLIRVDNADVARDPATAERSR